MVDVVSFPSKEDVSTLFLEDGCKIWKNIKENFNYSNYGSHVQNVQKLADMSMLLQWQYFMFILFELISNPCQTVS